MWPDVKVGDTHTPDAGHASGLRTKLASLQLTGNNLSFCLQLPGQTFKLQLLGMHKNTTVTFIITLVSFTDATYFLNGIMYVVFSPMHPQVSHERLKECTMFWLMIKRQFYDLIIVGFFLQKQTTDKRCHHQMCTMWFWLMSLSLTFEVNTEQNRTSSPFPEGSVTILNAHNQKVICAKLTSQKWC